jgi:hypothetical protein
MWVGDRRTERQRHDCAHPGCGHRLPAHTIITSGVPNLTIERSEMPAQ